MAFPCWPLLQAVAAVLVELVEFLQVELFEVAVKARLALVYLAFPLERLVLSVKCAFQMLFRLLACVDDAVGVQPRGVLRGLFVVSYQEKEVQLRLYLVKHFQLIYPMLETAHFQLISQQLMEASVLDYLVWSPQLLYVVKHYRLICQRMESAVLFLQLLRLIVGLPLGLGMAVCYRLVLVMFQ